MKPDGAFDFLACFTHNYREFLGNFSDFVGAMVESDDMASFRKRFSQGETNSMWQSLSFKPGYKAAYCLAVCPAGEHAIGGYLDDRLAYVEEVVKPLQDKARRPSTCSRNPTPRTGAAIATRTRRSSG